MVKIEEKFTVIGDNEKQQMNNKKTTFVEAVKQNVDESKIIIQAKNTDRG